MRKLLSALIVIAAVAATGACNTAAPEGGAEEQFTQGGVSMEPAVKPGQIITTRTVGDDYQPQRGDVVLFRTTDEKWVATTAPLLKRVVAVGGETVACCDPAGRITIDGKPIDEPYVVKNASLTAPAAPQSCGARRFAELKVAAGSIFVLGDNRAASVDSRCAGTIPTTSVFAVMVG